MQRETDSQALAGYESGCTLTLPSKEKGTPYWVWIIVAIVLFLILLCCCLVLGLLYRWALEGRRGGASNGNQRLGCATRALACYVGQLMPWFIVLLPLAEIMLAA